MASRNVLIDLDGTLADLQSAILRMLGRKMPSDCASSDGDLVKHFGLPQDFVKDHMDYDFWATINPTDEFDDILSIVESKVGRDNTFVITTVYDARGCIEGKRLWVEKFMGRGYPGRLFLVHDKSTKAADESLLIDDSNNECVSFFEAGGHSFLFPRPWNPLNGKQRDWKSLLGKSLLEFTVR